MPRLLPLLLILAALLPARLAGQRVYWSPDHGTLGEGKTSELRLVFEDCHPAGEVALPKIEGLLFSRPSSSTETTIVNLQMSRRTVLTYPAQPQQKGAIVIPAFDVRTNIGPVAVGEARFTVGAASVGQGSVPVTEIVEARLNPAKTTFWAGEVVPIDYVFLASPQYNTSLVALPEWAPAGLMLEPFGDLQRTDQLVRGELWHGAQTRTRFVVPAPGRLELAPLQQTVRVQTGERSFFSLSQPRMEEFTVASNRPAIHVRPLPDPAPAGFTGAVGTFQLESTVVPRHARVGEPVTWTLKLSGTGNWPVSFALPEREVSADFEVVQPKSRQEMQDNSLFTGSIAEDAILVPTKAGTYAIGSVRFTYFDTDTGAYRTLSADAVPVTITPGAPQTQPTSPAAPEAGPQPAGPDLAGAGSPRALPALPENLRPMRPLPLDPLAVAGGGLAPFAVSPEWWLAAALLPPLVVWLLLAWRRAWQTDPMRERRKARRELRRLLTRLVRSGHGPDAATLEGWRIHSARLWGVSCAVPTAADLGRVLGETGDAGLAEDWIGLWRDVEDALFGRSHALPPSWAERALAALRRTRLRRAVSGLPTRLQHWLPTAAAILVALFFLETATPVRAAGDPLVAYREGRFEEARAAWTALLATRPGDWALHNNIALTFAQEERWAEATAHWTAAFLLDPRAPGVAANLRLSVSHLDGIDPAVRRLVEGSWLDRVAATLAPAEWQMLQYGGGGLVALGLLLAVVALYRRRGGRAWRFAGGILVVAGVVAAAAGVAAERHYGILASPQAVFIVQPTELRSIPSELTERQQTSPVAPGTVAAAFADRTFLGWDKIRTGHAVEGWVRRSTYVPLFRSAPADPAAVASTGAAAP